MTAAEAPSAPASCVFCEIAAGRIPSHPLHSDSRLHAFLDIHPIRPGHALIIPRQHRVSFDELPPDLACDIVALGQRLAAALKRLYRVPRVAFLFTGTDVAHAHAHVVPMIEPTDITSRRYIAEETLTFRSTQRAAPAELDDVARRIRAVLAGKT